MSVSTPRQNSFGANLDKASTPAARSSSSPIGCRIYTARLTLTDNFLGTVEDVFDALTKEEVHCILCVECDCVCESTPIIVFYLIFFRTAKSTSLTPASFATCYVGTTLVCFCAESNSIYTEQDGSARP